MGKDLVKQDKNDLAVILEQKGMDKNMIADKLLELLDWEDTRYDKNGNAYIARDGNLRLKAIELWLKLQGGMGKSTNNHLHVSEGALDRLLGKNKTNKGKGKS